MTALFSIISLAVKLTIAFILFCSVLFIVIVLGSNKLKAQSSKTNKSRK